MADDDALGPISYLIVELPGNKMTGAGFEELIGLGERGLTDSRHHIGEIA